MKEKNMSKHIDKNTQDIPKYLKSTESSISKVTENQNISINMKNA